MSASWELRSAAIQGRIAPLLHRACDYEQLSWTLAQLQIIDFSRSFDDGCRELFRMWGVRYASADPR